MSSFILAFISHGGRIDLLQGKNHSCLYVAKRSSSVNVVSCVQNVTCFTINFPPDPILHVALDWSRRRDVLDRQEADLLSRVNEVRQRVVAGQVNSTTSYTNSRHL